MIANLLAQIPSAELVIPAWQMVLYVFLISIFMIAQDYKLSLITTYLFTLYWGFFLYFGDSVGSFASPLATLYALCGLLHVTCTVIAFWQQGP